MQERQALHDPATLSGKVSGLKNLLTPDRVLLISAAHTNSCENEVIASSRRGNSADGSAPIDNTGTAKLSGDLWVLRDNLYKSGTVTRRWRWRGYRGISRRRRRWCLPHPSPWRHSGFSSPSRYWSGSMSWVRVLNDPSCYNSWSHHFVCRQIKQTNACSECPNDNSHDNLVEPKSKHGSFERPLVLKSKLVLSYSWCQPKKGYSGESWGYR